jgi:hypothetical protein
MRRDQRMLRGRTGLIRGEGCGERRSRVRSFGFGFGRGVPASDISDRRVAADDRTSLVVPKPKRTLRSRLLFASWVAWEAMLRMLRGRTGLIRGEGCGERRSRVRSLPPGSTQLNETTPRLYATRPACRRLDLPVLHSSHRSSRRHAGLVA